MKEKIKILYHNKIFARLFHTLVFQLQRELLDCESVLDLGCGNSSPLQYCNNVKHSVGVEAFWPYLEESKRKGIHKEYLHKRIEELDFSENSFDAVILIEVIEHMPKEAGEDILLKAEKWAKKKIIVSSPNGFIAQKEVDNNPLQKHLSGWLSNDLKVFGYKCRGLAGFKFVRQEVQSETMGDDLLTSIRLKPKMLWFIFSSFSQLLTYFFPSLAFEIFSVKIIGKYSRCIVPDLVTLETKENVIKGFYFSDNFGFYPSSRSNNKFHYRAVWNLDLDIPKEYDFRNGYVFKLKNIWYYERKIFSIISLKFSFNQKTKIFVYNFWYKFFPFQIGNIMPIGKHISDIININLFLDGILVTNGSSFQSQGKVFCIMAPSFNGKTSLIDKMLDRGAGYVSENILIVDPFKKEVYPTVCQTKNYERSGHKSLHHKLNPNNTVMSKRSYDKIYAFQNSVNSNFFYGENKPLYEMLYLKSMFFLSNNFAMSYLYCNNLYGKIFRMMSEFKNHPDFLQEIKQTTNFNFSDLLKETYDQ